MSITRDELAVELRLGTSTDELALCQRRLDFASVAVADYVGAGFDDMPDVVANEGVVRLASFLYDQPNASSGDRFSNALRSSGAARLLTSYRKHGGGLTESQQDAEVEPPEDAMPETLMNVGHFDVPSSVGPAANIAATFTDGRFRAQVQNQSPALVRYYYGTTAPTDEDDYFIVADGYGVFDFVGGEPCWVIGRVISVPVTVALVS